MAASYERVICDDVQVGDVIARTRNDDFGEVIAISEGATSRYLNLTRVDTVERTNVFTGEVYKLEAGQDLGRIRPRRSAKLWKRVSA